MSSVLKSALLKSSAEAPNEWDLVELQGTLECSRGDPHAFRGVDLGEFHLDDKVRPILPTSIFCFVFYCVLPVESTCIGNPNSRDREQPSGR